jgi:hypothetical protein
MGRLLIVTDPSGRPAEGRPPDNDPVLPVVPEDERDEVWGDGASGGRRDEEWYRRERPPHHE